VDIGAGNVVTSTPLSDATADIGAEVGEEVYVVVKASGAMLAIDLASGRGGVPEEIPCRASPSPASRTRATRSRRS
jgi:hypothetical protein